MFDAIMILIVLVGVLVFTAWLAYGFGYSHAIHDTEYWISSACSDQRDDELYPNALKIRDLFFEDYHGDTKGNSTDLPDSPSVHDEGTGSAGPR